MVFVVDMNIFWWETPDKIIRNRLRIFQPYFEPIESL